MHHYFEDKTLRSITIVYDTRNTSFTNVLTSSFGFTAPSSSSSEQPSLLGMHTQLIGKHGHDDTFAALSTTKRCDADLFLETIRRSSVGDVILVSASSVLIPAAQRQQQEEETKESTTTTTTLQDFVERFPDAGLVFPGRIVSGREMLKAMLEQSAGGVLYLDTAFAVTAAHHQFMCGGSPAEQMRNTIATFLSAANEESYQESRNDVDRVWSLSSSGDGGSRGGGGGGGEVGDWYRLCARKFMRTRTQLDRSQFPCRIVPLNLCVATNHNKEDQQQLLLGDSHLLLSDLAHRLLQNIPALATLHRRVLSQRRGLCCTEIIAFTSRMALVKLDKSNHDHQHLIFDLLTSREWIENICKIEPMVTLEDASDYIASRPEKMFDGQRDGGQDAGGGIGSFGIVVFDEENRYKRRAAFGRPVPPAMLVGIAGLILRKEFAPDLDLGFALLPEFFGLGFATEAASLVMLWASRLLCLERVKAVARATNGPSCRLLERLGFERDDEKEEPVMWGEPQRIYVRRL